MSAAFESLVALSREAPHEFRAQPRAGALAAARAYVEASRARIRALHASGASGGNVVRMLSDAADTLLRGVLHFSMASVPGSRSLQWRTALCALGGYGRGELSPSSDLDVCLVYDGTLDGPLRELNAFLVPFLWDLGFGVGHAIRSVEETNALAREDLKEFIRLSESRLIAGDTTVFARVKLYLRELQSGPIPQGFIRERVQAHRGKRTQKFRDLYQLEPNLKDGPGGLRDYHTGLWLLMMGYGADHVEDAVSLGLLSTESHIELVEALNFMWRLRNELHFHTGRAENQMTYALQRHCAETFGYAVDEHLNLGRLMEDYYAAARVLRSFLTTAVRLCERPGVRPLADEGDGLAHDPGPPVNELAFGHDDPMWFAENPARLMEVFWHSARKGARLNPATEATITRNLPLITEAFQASEVVRHLFVAICSRPMQAGSVLRQMADTGVLARYLPEFADIQNIIRYADFHNYPVDEHTLRAVEALAKIPTLEGAVGRCLQEALEHLSDSHILVLAIVFHDMGKAAGEIHAEESVVRTHRICRRIGLREDDEERIAFLVRHHMTMTHISQYRDIDDIECVRAFAEDMKSDQRLRALFLLSYADLSAVGPGVWNDWKGALLMRLYLRAEKILQGRSESLAADYWTQERVDKVRAALPTNGTWDVDAHLKAMDERYFVAFTPDQIATHMACLADAEGRGLSVHIREVPELQMSEVVVSTRDRRGLFSMLAGSFSARLVDVNSAALFTHPNGFVIDVFMVADARQRRPLTAAESDGLSRTFREVLMDGRDVAGLVDESRKRLFALFQPRVPVRTRITFDNASSRTHTVIDIETGDRTGLLYDITRAMVDVALDIQTARIVTDARRIRDSFYVTWNGGKLADNEGEERVRQAIYRGIHPHSALETQRRLA